MSSNEPDLLEFVESIPPSLTVILVELAPLLSWLSWAVNVFRWQASLADSWLMVAIWWALCIIVAPFVKYLLPVALLSSFYLYRRKLQPRLTTEETLHSSITDLATLRILAPTHVIIPTIPPRVTARVAGILLPPWLIACYFVKTRIIALVLGWIFLTWNAPWCRNLRDSLWRSSILRRALARAWARLSGQPENPSFAVIQSIAPTSDTAKEGPKFIFTVLENQRWWMGLDWTAALLPNERPSWCTTNLQAISPPSLFALPPPTTVFHSDGKGLRIRRHAVWSWVEPEWKVVVRKENADGQSVLRVEKPLPVVTDERDGLARAADKMKGFVYDNKDKPASGRRESDAAGDDLPPPSVSDESIEEHLTDLEGWVYSDNKWETPSNKGGIGKYTRFRRWTRIATLTETVEEVGEGAFGVSRATVQPQSVQPPHPPDDSANGSSGGNRLKQRLKAAVKGAAS
ncbi:hypothetical protein SISNIDRAFT_435493 [Sistotremastrum niveocremeum HHB9708]|uniref:TECPR1-like DysF domain-containing protein n=1 Tax=Sistotremastrum niveocremeum HHB9708 TaxID=1314777 RepID=A0A165A2R3_9AGAM|nr:hypothetical protein SISNIDRAFT_435493 [Sistotremastrum niveocremeum HHB9708]